MKQQRKAFSYFPSFSFTFTIIAQNEGKLPHHIHSFPFLIYNNLCFPHLDISQANLSAFLLMSSYVVHFFFFLILFMYKMCVFLWFINKKQFNNAIWNKSIWCARWFHIYARTRGFLLYFYYYYYHFVVFVCLVSSTLKRKASELGKISLWIHTHMKNLFIIFSIIMI